MSNSRKHKKSYMEDERRRKLNDDESEDFNWRQVIKKMPEKDIEDNEEEFDRKEI